MRLYVPAQNISTSWAEGGESDFKVAFLANAREQPVKGQQNGRESCEKVSYLCQGGRE